MAGRRPLPFIDTNVLLCVASGDPAKAEKAQAILAAGGVISVQVLNEIANIARRKMRLSWSETHAFLSTVRALLDVEDLTVSVHDTALRVAERYQLSTYDSLIVASALVAGCDTVLSEDMQNDLTIDGVLRITNPFIGV